METQLTERDTIHTLAKTVHTDHHMNLILLDFQTDFSKAFDQFAPSYLHSKLKLLCDKIQVICQGAVLRQVLVWHLPRHDPQTGLHVASTKA